MASSFAYVRDMAPPASYSHFEGATDDADPMARQPWGELTPNLRHVANPDVDVDITGQQEPVDVHAQDQSSLHHASDNYRNLCYFNSWQEALLGAPPDPTTHSTGTPWMPLGQNMCTTIHPCYTDSILTIYDCSHEPFQSPSSNRH